MNKYIAFLRAINVGGRNIKMDELKNLFLTLGFANVETFIASGNVIFESNNSNSKNLENIIEQFLLNTLAYEIETFIRTNLELPEILKFAEQKDYDLKLLTTINIAFVKEPLNTNQKLILSDLETEIDSFYANGREVYWFCKLKQSESKFSNAVFERNLKLKATFRGIKTIQRLAVKYP